jgi:hypothetical protein
VGLFKDAAGDRRLTILGVEHASRRIGEPIRVAGACLSFGHATTQFP